MADEITPAQVAGYDQAHAVIAASLDTLIDGHRANLQGGEAPELAVVGLAHWINEHFSGLNLAEHLAVAVDRLARQECDR